MQNQLPKLEEIADLLNRDQKLRKEAASSSFEAFVAIYLKDLFNEALKPFHRLIMAECANFERKNTLITGFRGSGKSTIANTAFILWAALTKRYNFIVAIGDTSEQSKQMFRNIRVELEENELLRADFGDQRVWGSEWQTQKMLLKNGIMILGKSRGQKVRGLRHGRYRPDCIVIDDPEEAEWVESKENRDKSERWIRREVFPAMATGRTKVIVIGNFLHDDALLARLKKSGLFENPINIPLFPNGDESKECVWPEKFTPEVIAAKKKEAGFIGWNFEYLMKIVPRDGQIIVPEDIHFYGQIPEGATQGIVGHGVDPAISKTQTADCSAIVTGIVYRWEGKARICVLPGVVNQKLGFAELVNTIIAMNTGSGIHAFYIEANNYQRAIVETLELRQVPVVGLTSVADKRARLQIASQFIKDGTVEFPKTGCEQLLSQLYGFGAEEHDDMVDALVNLILATVAEGLDLRKIVWVQT